MKRVNSSLVTMIQELWLNRYPIIDNNNTATDFSAVLNQMQTRK